MVLLSVFWFVFERDESADAERLISCKNIFWEFIHGVFITGLTEGFRARAERNFEFVQRLLEEQEEALAESELSATRSKRDPNELRTRKNQIEKRFSAALQRSNSLKHQLISLEELISVRKRESENLRKTLLRVREAMTTSAIAACKSVELQQHRRDYAELVAMKGGGVFEKREEEEIDEVGKRLQKLEELHNTTRLNVSLNFIETVPVTNLSRHSSSSSSSSKDDAGIRYEQRLAVRTIADVSFDDMVQNSSTRALWEEAKEIATTEGCLLQFCRSDAIHDTARKVRSASHQKDRQKAVAMALGVTPTSSEDPSADLNRSTTFDGALNEHSRTAGDEPGENYRSKAELCVSTNSILVETPKRQSIIATRDDDWDEAWRRAVVRQQRQRIASLISASAASGHFVAELSAANELDANPSTSYSHPSMHRFKRREFVYGVAFEGISEKDRKRKLELEMKSSPLSGKEKELYEQLQQLDRSTSQYSVLVAERKALQHQFGELPYDAKTDKTRAQRKRAPPSNATRGFMKRRWLTMRTLARKFDQQSQQKERIRKAHFLVHNPEEDPPLVLNVLALNPFKGETDHVQPQPGSPPCRSSPRKRQRVGLPSPNATPENNGPMLTSALTRAQSRSLQAAQ